MRAWQLCSCADGAAVFTSSLISSCVFLIHNLPPSSPPTLLFTTQLLTLSLPTPLLNHLFTTKTMRSSTLLLLGAAVVVPTAQAAVFLQCASLLLTQNLLQGVSYLYSTRVRH